MEEAAGSPLLVGLIGPPGAGKSTLTANLVRHFSRGPSAIGNGFVEGRIFRLRESAHEYRHSQGLWGREDRLGWLPERTVDLLMHAAVDQGRISTSGITVLEGFPGSRSQVRLLSRLADEVAAAACILQLTVPREVSSKRIQNRRVCPVCEPDPAGDPHRPAHASSTDPTRCVTCGGRLMRRPSDEARALAMRRNRYRRRLPGLCSAAADLSVPHLVVDATGRPDRISNAVLALLDSLRGGIPMFPAPDQGDLHDIRRSAQPYPPAGADPEQEPGRLRPCAATLGSPRSSA